MEEEAQPVIAFKTGKIQYYMDIIIVLDFGGQYTHLISRRIRDLNVFSKVLPAETSVEKIKAINGLKGVILSGGAASVYDKDSPKCDK